MGPSIVYVTDQRKVKPYTLLRFLWDCFMVFITSGFWLIWIAVREARNLRNTR